MSPTTVAVTAIHRPSGQSRAPRPVDALTSDIARLAARIDAYTAQQSPQREQWMDRAACLGANPADFFPGRGESTEPARQVCRSCPAAEACLTHALATTEKFGVWGGLSERERRRLRRALRQHRQARTTTAVAS